MKKPSNRRSFIFKSVSGIALASSWPILSNSQIGDVEELSQEDMVSATFPSQDLASVRDVVGASHGNIEKVKELVSARPALAKATYDWGFGDWESALGAASHMGRPDIAEILISHGARPNIYTLAMLGKVNAVKQMVEAIPGVQSIRGPHGITLLSHAKMRLRRKDYIRDDELKVKETIAYLESLGDADIMDTSLEMTDEEKQIYLGTYMFGEKASERFTVTLNSRNMLFLSRGEMTGRVLLKVEEHTFAPGGASAVRVQFAVEENRAMSLTIHDPMPLVKAQRGEG